MKNKILKISASLATFIVSNIPIYFGGFLWWIFAPVGFWQQIAFLFLSFIFLGGIQLWFWFVGGSIIFGVITNSFETKKVIGR